MANKKKVIEELLLNKEDFKEEVTKLNDITRQIFNIDRLLVVKSEENKALALKINKIKVRFQLEIIPEAEQNNVNHYEREIIAGMKLMSEKSDELIKLREEKSILDIKISTNQLTIVKDIILRKKNADIETIKWFEGLEKKVKTITDSFNKVNEKASLVNKEYVETLQALHISTVSPQFKDLFTSIEPTITTTLDSRRRNILNKAIVDLDRIGLVK